MTRFVLVLTSFCLYSYFNSYILKRAHNFQTITPTLDLTKYNPCLRSLKRITCNFIQLIYLFCLFQDSKRKTNWVDWEHWWAILFEIYLKRYRGRFRKNQSRVEFGRWGKRRWFWWFKYQEVHEWISCVKPCQNKKEKNLFQLHQ